MALTPNQLADDYKILGEEKYTFFLLACKISAKSVQQKRRYCCLKFRPIFKKRAMFQFWGKIQVFGAISLKLFSNIDYILIDLKSKKNLKNLVVFFIFWLKKQKIMFQNLGVVFKKGQFKENIKINGAYLMNLLPLSVPTYFQNFKGVH